MTKHSPTTCPRCHEGQLRSWKDLTEEEQMIVRRLPASADYPLAERQSTHRWCTRCWFELLDGEYET